MNSSPWIDPITANAATNKNLRVNCHIHPQDADTQDGYDHEHHDCFGRHWPEPQLYFFAKPSLISAPFFIAGTLKIVYDLLLYKAFVTIHPPEEH